MFLSSLRHDSEFAGVFEADEDTGYFYLYKPENLEGQRVLGAIHVWSGEPPIKKRQLSIEWSKDDTVVGLLIDGRPWAAFETETGKRHGGEYSSSRKPRVPVRIAAKFGNGTRARGSGRRT